MSGHALLLPLGVVAVWGALALMLMLADGVRSERRAVGRSLAVLTTVGHIPPQPRSLPLRDRVLRPGLQRLARLGRGLSPVGAVEKLVRQLDLAGNPPAWPLERVLAVKALGLVVAPAATLWLLSGTGLLRAGLPALAAAAAGFFLPDLLVYNAGVKRQAEIEQDLADALDLLTISVEAGLGFDAALAQVARNTEGPLAGEFFRVLQEMQIGKSRAEAFRALAGRSNVAELSVFVGSVVQADNLGIPIARVLREQSKEMRLARRQRAEEKAMKVPVKILFPMVVFILPVLFVVILAPGAMSIVATLKG